ncbi:NAD(P)/FAD-dependent oxidoreductase [Microbacterium paludicola]|uniref:NAD(P)/FAD-dependent oxidoreductase n=1 Tax=Microbacterium paludicola TaxID=300019 RepID=A0A4Y9FUY5_9MICO|nr:NAD(P)/FAD-dependent oxidoreductase [Microbacterium paludicola]MBF0816191.1 NAD(P)/FAD-dependent oxidoreductase [Microbacterium paludicola]TFU33129.1 NAD(P)/FAD-dependent oxidoreductase [Microbacterium paludicola]
MTKIETDVVVIGAGPVGENVADRAVRGGLEAVIVEAELVGGECSYWACMPSKALLRPGAALRAAQAVEGVTGGVLDPAAVLKRRDGFAANWNDSGQVQWLDSAGISLVRGRGRVAGERRVIVEGEDGETEIVARHAVVIATGSEARIPDIPGLRAAKPWTSREVTSAQTIPRRLAVLGGGVVAVEAATMFADLGSQVTLLSRSPLLRSLEPFAGEAVRDALRARGVTVREDASAAEVTRHDDGSVRILLDGGEEILADEVAVAMGRAPRVRGIGVDDLLGDHGLDVDDTLRVAGTEWLYAVGDAAGRVLLTHQGKYEARAAGDAIAARAKGEPVDDAPWGRHVATADHAAVPQVVFTDPEVASAGLTAAEAEKRGMRIRVVDYDLSHVAGAGLIADDYAGRARAVVDEDRGVLVGLTLVGPGVGEQIHAATIAIAGEVPLARLWHAVPSYPTLSEFWLRLLEEYGL